MSFVNISAIRTADPGNIWVAKNSFRPSDPFAVVLDVQVDNSVVQAGLVFDATFQINNPRDDPHSTSWYTILDGDAYGMTSVGLGLELCFFPMGNEFCNLVVVQPLLGRGRPYFGGRKIAGHILCSRGGQHTKLGSLRRIVTILVQSSPVKSCAAEWTRREKRMPCTTFTLDMALSHDAEA